MNEIDQHLLNLLDALRRANQSEIDVLAQVAALVERRAASHAEIMQSLGHLVPPPIPQQQPQPVHQHMDIDPHDPRHAEAIEAAKFEAYRRHAPRDHGWN